MEEQSLYEHPHEHRRGYGVLEEGVAGLAKNRLQAEETFFLSSGLQAQTLKPPLAAGTESSICLISGRGTFSGGKSPQQTANFSVIFSKLREIGGLGVFSV